jgi:hypothetical protein
MTLGWTVAEYNPLRASLAEIKQRNTKVPAK